MKARTPLWQSDAISSMSYEKTLIMTRVFADVSICFDGLRAWVLKLFSGLDSIWPTELSVLSLESSSAPMSYGVPHGSVLGPLLFSLYLLALGPKTWYFLSLPCGWQLVSPVSRAFLVQVCRDVLSIFSYLVSCFVSARVDSLIFCNGVFLNFEPHRTWTKHSF